MHCYREHVPQAQIKEDEVKAIYDTSGCKSQEVVPLSTVPLVPTMKRRMLT
jgi:hypothetical protein